jgi:hypothetical protein
VAVSSADSVEEAVPLVDERGEPAPAPPPLGGDDRLLVPGSVITSEITMLGRNFPGGLSLLFHLHGFQEKKDESPK